MVRLLNSKSTAELHSKSRPTSNNNSKGGKSSKSSSALVEKQGPIDWSYYGLKSKYRGESEREEAWRDWLNSVSLSKSAVNDDNMILPVTKVERHPFYNFYYKRLYEENLLSSNRTKSRLLMKRFVFDVQEVWLTNLQHLNEHKPENMFGASVGAENDDSSSNFGRGTGIKNRRDVKALESMESQIQSVSQRRVFDKAYFTVRMPAINVMLDFTPAPTPSLRDTRLLPPSIETLVECLPLSLDGERLSSEAPRPHSERDFLLHVDRLVPSSDYLVAVQPEVLWRLSLFRRTDMRSQVFVATEADVAAYIARVILERTSSVPSSGSGDRTELRLALSQVVFMSAPQLQLPCQSRSAQSVSCQVTVSLLGFTRSSLSSAAVQEVAARWDELRHFKVEISAACDAEGQCFYLECSPAELRWLLRVPTALLFSAEWWLDPVRVNDLWPFLLSHLHIQMEGGTAVGLGFRQMERTAADRVENALSTLEALSCAYEMTDLLLLSCVEPEAHQDEEHSLGDSSSLEELPSSASFPALDLRYLSPSQSFLIHVAAPPEVSDARARSLQLEEAAEVLRSEGGLCEPLSVSLEAADEASLQETDRDAVLRRDVYSGRWEALVNHSGYNLSLLASGGVPLVAQVPGVCEHGRKGLWFPDMNTSVESTQASAKFFRDQHVSTSDSVLVNITLALDTALLRGELVAWEDYSTFPDPTPNEEVSGAIPFTRIAPHSLRSELLASPIRDRLSHTVMVFGSLPTEGVDFLPLDAPRKPSGYCRHLPTKNEFGFRQQVEVRLLGVDPVLSTMVFGVTRMGALPNTLSVNTRNLWHNTIAITEHINRPRAPKDYHYILSNLTSCGANDPTSYTTRMRASEMVGLTSSAFSAYEDQYSSIKELRSAFHRQLALDSKIEKVRSDLRLKEQMEVSLIRNELQRAYEKKLRKANKSEVGWRGRYKMSSLLELQGNWERRRDDRSGLYFFHQIVPVRYSGDGERVPEKFAESCQWEVPAQWDGDPLSSGTAVGTVVEGDVEHDPLMRGSAIRGGGGRQAAPKGLRDLSSVASFYSELEEEDLDLYDLPQTTATRRATAGVPQHMLATGTTGKGKGSTPFDQPPDSWYPGSVTRQTVSSRGRMAETSQKLFNPATRLHKRRSSAHSEESGLDSVGADKSVAESFAPTIDTVNLEHIAEQLVSSDELMRVIARRLGLPESQVVAADDLSSVFSITSGKGRLAPGASTSYEPMNAPRDEWADDLNEPEFDSDEDLWSDDEHVVGDFDEEKELGAREDMPANQLEAAQLKRRQWRETHQKEDTSAPASVPYLHLPKRGSATAGGGAMVTFGEEQEGETREEVFGWRRLPRPAIKPGFLSNSLLTHTRGPDKESSNTLNRPIFMMPISPVDACKYVPEEFTAVIESIFVPDAKKDMERSIATVERNIRREEELSRNLPTDDLLLFGEAKEFTSVDAYLARQHKEDQAAVADPKEEAREKAILAAKSSNIAQMEDALAEDIPINTADEFGNSLLILAAQQGSRRMVKFLLRRGANINFQSLAGNTPLHYCYAYSQHSLGDYLKQKGADDSIINVDGLTCYEGLSRQSMEEEFGDNEREEDFYGDNDQYEEEEE